MPSVAAGLATTISGRAVVAFARRIRRNAGGSHCRIASSKPMPSFSDRGAGMDCYSSSAGPFGLSMPSPGTASQAREPDSPLGFRVRPPFNPF